MAADRYDLTVPIGRRTQFWIDVKDENGDPVDLTGYTFAGGIKEHEHAEALTAEITGDIADPESGSILCTISTEESENLAHRPYVWDCYTLLGLEKDPLLYGDVTTLLPITP
jgi:anti-sigma factor ChrR (cupin superfamily)